MKLAKRGFQIIMQSCFAAASESEQKYEYSSQTSVYSRESAVAAIFQGS